LREDDLAADFEALWEVSGLEFRLADVERDAADGADVRGDVFAGGAVAARYASGECSLALLARDVLECE
jgi:hypothetical protein